MPKFFRRYFFGFKAWTFVQCYPEVLSTTTLSPFAGSYSIYNLSYILSLNPHKTKLYSNSITTAHNNP